MTGSRQPPVAQRAGDGEQPEPLDRMIADSAWISPIAESDDTVIVGVPAERLVASVGAVLRRPGARFADMFATEGSPLTLRTVVALDSEARYLVLQTAITDGIMPWLSAVTPAAFVEECELFEQFGLQPRDAHLLNRLVVAPVSAPEHPQLDEHAAPTGDTHLRHTVSGQAFEFPAGPVRGAAVESLYYGLVTSGEEVVDLYLHTWHKYRGIERRLRGMTPREALFFVERAEGLSAAASSVAFATSVEGAQGLAVSDPVGRARAIYLELERLYNHAQCAAALAQSTGLFIGQAQAEIAVELLLRLNAAAAGHRYLFGVVDIADGRPVDGDALRQLLPEARGELCRVLDALLGTNSFLDRVEATGIVTAEQSANLGLVGPHARACGARIDTRFDHTPLGRQAPDMHAAVQEAGDCLARLVVRREEVDQSARLIDLLLDGEFDLSTAGLEPRSWGLGAAESPRGETLSWTELDEDGHILRARLRTASVRNWRAFDDAVRSQNVFTDVPIIEASFWLTAAGRAL